MEFYPDLYIGEKVEKPGVLLKKIKKQKKLDKMKLAKLKELLC